MNSTHKLIMCFDDREIIPFIEWLIGREFTAAEVAMLQEFGVDEELRDIVQDLIEELIDENPDITVEDSDSGAESENTCDDPDSKEQEL